MNRILVVEDSEATRNLLAEELGSHYDLTLTASVQAGLAAACSGDFALMLVDLTLPDGDGFEFCKRLATASTAALPPFIFLTGRYDIQDKLTAFALGAEDYVLKPFDPQELLARVKIRMRRTPAVDAGIHLGTEYGLSIDSQALRVLVREPQGDRDAQLTPNEFKILQALLLHAGTPLSRAQLLRAGWGHGVHVLERTIDKHVSGLRRKLGSSGVTIAAVPGQGYCLTKAAG